MYYKEYIKSDSWRTQREKAIKLSNGKCFLCNRKFNKGLSICVHHKNYKYPYGSKDELKNLVCLCEDCHSLFHKNYKYDNFHHVFLLYKKRKKKKISKKFKDNIVLYFNGVSGFPEIGKIFKNKSIFRHKYIEYGKLRDNRIKPTSIRLKINPRQLGCITWYYNREIFNTYKGRMNYGRILDKHLKA